MQFTPQVFVKDPRPKATEPLEVLAAPLEPVLSRYLGFRVRSRRVLGTDIYDGDPTNAVRCIRRK